MNTARILAKAARKAAAAKLALDSAALGGGDYERAQSLDAESARLTARATAYEAARKLGPDELDGEIEKLRADRQLKDEASASARAELEAPQAQESKEHGTEKRRTAGAAAGEEEPRAAGDGPTKGVAGRRSAAPGGDPK